LLQPRESAPSCEAVRCGGSPRCSNCRPTSVNSGVAHPIFLSKQFFLKLLAIVHSLAANLTERILSVDLFTGLLVGNYLRFINQIVLALVFGINLDYTHTNSRIQVPKKLLKLLNFKMLMHQFNSWNNGRLKCLSPKLA